MGAFLCVLFLENTCCALRLRGRSLLWRGSGVVLGRLQCGLGLGSPYQKRHDKEPRFPVAKINPRLKLTTGEQTTIKQYIRLLGEELAEILLYS